MDFVTHLIGINTWSDAMIELWNLLCELYLRGIWILVSNIDIPVVEASSSASSCSLTEGNQCYFELSRRPIWDIS